MKFITPKIHGIIDYLLVIILLISPTVLGLKGLIATFAYALAGLHLLMTILTNFSAGLIKLIPFPVHGVIELIVGIGVIALAFTRFRYNMTDHLFCASVGVAILLVWLFTDYKGAKAG